MKKSIKFEIIKKAYKVWHEGMINEHNPNEGYYSFAGLPITFAKNANHAKTIAREPYDWNLKGERPNYIDLKVRRCAGADIIMVNGNQINRSCYKMEQEHNEKIKIRTDKINKYPDTEMFYIQNGYVGNCVNWWGLNSSGYTTDITKAQKYSKKEVLQRFSNGREEDRIWAASHVEQHIKQTVDSQYLEYEFVS